MRQPSADEGEQAIVSDPMEELENDVDEQVVAQFMVTGDVKSRSVNEVI